MTVTFFVLLVEDICQEDGKNGITKSLVMVVLRTSPKAIIVRFQSRKGTMYRFPQFGYENKSSPSFLTHPAKAIFRTSSFTLRRLSSHGNILRSL